jgi:hypothetical protein
MEGLLRHSFLWLTTFPYSGLVEGEVQSTKVEIYTGQPYTLLGS